MARLAPVLFILAALIVAGVFLFGGGDDTDEGIDYGEDNWVEENAPELRTSEGARSGTRRPSAETKKNDAETREPPRGRTRFITGTVLDAASGAPIAGATLRAEHADDMCPRLDFGLHSAAGVPFGERARRGPSGPAPLVGSATTGKDGTFSWWVGSTGILADAYDVFASAPGYVTASSCRPRVGDEITIKLSKAIGMAVTVTDPHGRPIEFARLMVRPAPETRALPGTAGTGVTDENGRGQVAGLAPSRVDPETGEPTRVVLHVDHPDWMPFASEPFDPSVRKVMDLKLEPALKLTLKIRSDDGTGISTPILTWATDGDPPAGHVGLLTVSPNGPEAEPTSEVVSEAVRIPCSHENVLLEVKADGFSAWQQKEPLPADGGTREVIAILRRDTGLGSVTLRYKGPDGTEVPYTALGSSSPEFARLDPGNVGSVAIEQGKVLVIKSLPPGRYRVTKRSPTYAPAVAEFEVREGEPVDETIQLEKAAKLRVRFTSGEQTTVAFRLLQGREIMPAFPLKADGTPMERSDERGAALDAGTGGGALFSGLPTGRVTIEVTSPDLVAPLRAVDLTAGETTEVEIEVRRR